VKEVPELKRRYAREIQVHGSGRLAAALLANDLVDRMTLWHFPVALGAGKRLFGQDTLPTAFALERTVSTGKGVVVSTYRRVGRPSFGAFGLET
jgi:dihydrofolate reductase